MLIENKKIKETWDGIIVPESIRGQALAGLPKYLSWRSGVGRTPPGERSQSRFSWQSLAGWHHYLSAEISPEKSTLVYADHGRYRRKFRSNGRRN